MPVFVNLNITGHFALLISIESELINEQLRSSNKASWFKIYKHLKCNRITQKGILIILKDLNYCQCQVRDNG